MSDCGCRMEVCRLDEDVKAFPYIKYCPLHAAAGQTRDALSDVMQVAFDGPREPVSSTAMQAWKRGIEARAREALAATEAKP